MKLYPWQTKTIELWSKEKNGIIEAGTGTGKTAIALEIIRQLKISVLVAVPTQELLVQWREALLSIGCPADMIGELGDGKKEIKKYTIGIYNTIRELLPEGFALLVIDECHHVCSKENQKILDVPHRYFLGLTATLARPDGEHLALIKKHPVVFTYTQQQAVEERILASYTITPVWVDLSIEERLEYDKADAVIKRLFPLFNYDLKKVHNTLGSYMHPHFQDARKLTEAFNYRKEIILKSEERINRTAEIVNEFVGYEKIIVFSELKETAERIYNLVNAENKFLYHSGLKRKERKEVYEKFKACKNGVVISCKALEEGVDFPSCKMGIISGGTSQSRQAIQRIGRFLRRYGDMEAEVFDLVVRNTKDTDWHRARYKGV